MIIIILKWRKHKSNDISADISFFKIHFVRRYANFLSSFIFNEVLCHSNQNVQLVIHGINIFNNYRLI